jgi:Flp pilus assembly pilin Flp
VVPWPPLFIRLEVSSGGPTGSYRTREVTAVAALAKRRWKFTHYHDERGAAMVEYSLIVALIAVVAFGLVGAVGDATVDLYTETRDAIHALIG